MGFYPTAEHDDRFVSSGRWRRIPSRGGDSKLSGQDLTPNTGTDCQVTQILTRQVLTNQSTGPVRQLGMLLHRGKTSVTLRDKSIDRRSAPYAT